MPKKRLLDSIRSELSDFKEDLGFSREDRSDARAEDGGFDDVREELTEAASAAGRTLGALGRRLGQAATEAAEAAKRGLDDMLDVDDDGKSR